MKKKITVIAITAVMLCIVIFSQTAVFAAESTATPTIRVQTAEASHGDKEVSVNISVFNNPGIDGMKLIIDYPPEKLELTSVENADLLKGWQEQDISALKGQVTAVWTGDSTDDVTKNGKILTLVFNVADIAELTGLIDVKVSYNKGDIVNVSGSEVDFELTNGGINIRCKHDGSTYISGERDTGFFEEGYSGDTYCGICNEVIAKGASSISHFDVILFLANGFVFSLIIFAVTLLCGIPLGLPIAFCSMSRFKPVRFVAKTFVWIIRGIPLMLQIFIIYYAPGLLFGTPIFSNIDRYIISNFTLPDDGVLRLLMINAGGLVSVLIAFTLNYACYFSEIYRGGIESVPKGQYEAGYVLGMSKSQVFKKIVLKQVIKRIVPPMSNEIITLIKDTALANCIMIPEIIKQAKELAATKALIWPLFFTGVFYLLFVGLLTILLGKVEKKLSYFRD